MFGVWGENGLHQQQNKQLSIIIVHSFQKKVTKNCTNFFDINEAKKNSIYLYLFKLYFIFV